MAVKFKGSTSPLVRLRAQLLSVKDGRSLLARAIKKRATTLLEEGYSNRRDPYGKKWKNRKKAQPWPLLEETGKTRGTLKVRVTGGSLLITVGRFGVFHQPTRPIIPDDRGLPPRWTADFAKIVEQQLFDALR